MNEEISDDKKLSPGEPSPLAELITQYCSGVEERIRSTNSREEATTIVEETCQAFERECKSEIIRTSLNRYISNLFREYWGREKNHTSKIYT